MPGPRAIAKVPSFDGGLVINKHPTQLKANEASILRNVEFGNRGGLRRRSGTTVFGPGISGSTAWEGSIPFVVKSASGIRLLVGFRNGGAYYCNLSAGHTYWTSFASGFTTGRKWGGAVFGNTLYYGNGVDPIHALNLETLTDSVLAATSGTVPKGNVFLIYKFRLLVTGDEANPHILYASSVGELDRWDTSVDQALAQVIGARDGEGNLGLVSLGNGVKVIRSNGEVFSLDVDENGIWRLEEDGAVLPCASKYAVVKAENDIVTFGWDGVYSYGNQANYFGGERQGEISANISPLWDSFMPNPEYGYYIQSKENAAAVYYKGNLIFACQVAGGTANNRILVCNPERKYIWCEWTGLSVGAFILDQETEELWMLSSTSGAVWKSSDHASDSGAAIDFVYQSGALNFDPPHRTTVRWVYLDYLADSGLSGTLSVTTDEDTATGASFPITSPAPTAGTASGSTWGADEWGTTIWGGATPGTFTQLGDIVARKDMLLKGRYVRAKVRTNQAGVAFELYGLTFVKKTRTLGSYRYDQSP